MVPHPVQSVGDVIRMIFPRGTNQPTYVYANLTEIQKANPLAAWLLPPQLQTDLFAVAAYVCKVGGIVGFFNPDPYATGGEHGDFVFDRTHRDLLDTTAWRWRGGMRGGRRRYGDTDLTYQDRLQTCEHSSTPPEYVVTCWGDLIRNWDAPVHCGHYIHQEAVAAPPEWWRTVFSLLIISDLAMNRPFRGKEKTKHLSPMEMYLKSLFLAGDRAIPDAHARAADKGSKVSTAPRGPASLGLMADTTVACVMPKYRVAPVGTTLRNVTRNLALLPGRGEMRCVWDLQDKSMPNEDGGTLDILLIPAPFRLNAHDFAPCSSDGRPNDELHTNKPDWENFDVAQTWLGGKHDPTVGLNAVAESFISDCEKLLRAAKSETRKVNGVVFPEYALTHDIFMRLCDKLKDAEPRLEFVVAGSSDNCLDKRANTVLTRVWVGNDNKDHLTSSRRKHHRWRLDRRQVEMYGLGTALNPKVANWWETTPVGQRELHFHRFRRDSIFAALICEELARSDVCHDILRAIGPNLVFALLMDSAQLPNRWPGQYAAALADDPGSAVLSLTSYGLVERSNRLRSDGSQSIALWKDDTGKLVTIDMPKGEGARGVLLSLWSQHVKDQTILGKRSEIRAWRYSSHVAVGTLGLLS